MREQKRACVTGNDRTTKTAASLAASPRSCSRMLIPSGHALQTAAHVMLRTGGRAAPHESTFGSLDPQARHMHHTLGNVDGAWPKTGRWWVLETIAARGQRTEKWQKPAHPTPPIGNVRTHDATVTWSSGRSMNRQYWQPLAPRMVQRKKLKGASAQAKKTSPKDSHRHTKQQRPSRGPPSAPPPPDSS